MAKKQVKSTKSKTKGKARKPAARKGTKAPARPNPRTITPYLTTNDAAGAIEWYKRVFGAKETSRQLAGPKIMHASIVIGDSEVYLCDIMPGTDAVDASRVGSPVAVHVYSKNFQKFWGNAIANGAKVVMPLGKQFWGDWYGQLRDPFGHAWGLNWPAKMTEAEKTKLRDEAMTQFGAPLA